MDTIILGLLMAGKLTIYEIRKHIETNFTSISSNSMGSIQTTLKKLLEKGCIIYNEYVENGVNKKAYEITETGKDYFYVCISEPMRYKEKNMELSKFFFLGFVEEDRRIKLLKSYIAQLKKETARLKTIRDNSMHREPDENYLELLRQGGAAREITEFSNGKPPLEKLKDIVKYQLATLELSISKMEYEIQWFEDFKAGLQDKEKA